MSAKVLTVSSNSCAKAGTVDADRFETEIAQAADDAEILQHAVTVAACTRRRTSSGVSLGAKKPIQVACTKPGAIVSATVGTFGKGGVRLRTRDGERHELARLRLLRAGGEGDGSRIDVARHEVLHQRPATAIGNVRHPEVAGCPQQQLTGEVLRAADAGHADIEPAWPEARRGSELLDRPDARFRMGEQALWALDRERDGLERLSSGAVPATGSASVAAKVSFASRSV